MGCNARQSRAAVAVEAETREAGRASGRHGDAVFFGGSLQKSPDRADVELDSLGQHRVRQRILLDKYALAAVGSQGNRDRFRLVLRGQRAMGAAGIFAGAKDVEPEGEQASIDVQREQIGFIEAAWRSGNYARQAWVAACHHRRHEIPVWDLRGPAGFSDRMVESDGCHVRSMVGATDVGADMSGFQYFRSNIYLP
jgi:hypothetical protein